uniref:TIR domain-containing protein n=1 Tax=Hucho hucho TaxID=62062 RepID=A0A4W5K4A3_9TELE
IFHNLTKLEVLELDNCRIYSLEGSLTKDFKSLKTLYLCIENIYNVFYSFTEPLSSLKYLAFKNVQMFCSCDNAWFITWAKGYRQVEVLMLSPYADPSIYALEDLICLLDNRLDTANFVKYTEANCTTEVGFVLFAETGLGILFFMLVVVLFHNLAGPYLLPLYHITLGCLSGALRSNTRGSYHYDLGKDIVENITDSLYRSRHTLCLVSRHYLRSNWYNMLFYKIIYLHIYSELCLDWLVVDGRLGCPAEVSCPLSNVSGVRTDTLWYRFRVVEWIRCSTLSF